MKLTEEEFSYWAKDPVTKTILKMLKENADDMMDSMKNSLLDRGIVKEDISRLNITISRADSYYRLSNLEYSHLIDFLEDDNDKTD